MRKRLIYTILIFWVSLLFFGLAHSPISEAASDVTLTVMTFNIRVGSGMINPGTSPHKLKDSPKVLDLVAQAIKSVSPDAVGLQEVQGDDQAKTLAEALDMNYVYKRHGWDEDARWWGVAFLSKHNIIKSKSYTVYSGGDMSGRARILLACTIALKGKKITFFNTHFKDKGNALKKEPKYTIKKISKCKNPVILMGDLNAVPEDPRLKPIKEVLKDSCEAVANENSAFIKTNGTFQSPNDPKYDHWRIDYIFYDPKSFRVMEVGLIDKQYWDASDHIGYFCRMELL